MKTMKKAGKLALWASLALLALAALAAPASAANVDFQMWVEDPASPGVKITDLANLTPGDYNLVVQARVRNNLSVNRFITGAAGAKKAYAISGALENWAFNLVDSTGTGPTSSLAFADDGFGGWQTTAGPLAQYPTPAANALNATAMVSGVPVGNFDVLNVGAMVGITTANLAITNNIGNPTLLKYGAVGPQYIGASLTDGSGGTTPAVLADSARWFTLITGGFTYTGGHALLSMDLNPALVGQNVAVNSGTNGATFTAPKLAAANSTVATTLEFGKSGPVNDYNTQALAVMTANAAMMSATTPDNWAHVAPGGWWKSSSSITLDGSAALDGGAPITEWKWTITDATYPGINTPATYITYGEHPTIYVGDLMAAGFQTPPTRRSGSNDPWTFGTVGLNIYDGVEGGANTIMGYGGTSPLLLPEPASMFILAFGAVGALLRRRRK